MGERVPAEDMPNIPINPDVPLAYFRTYDEDNENSWNRLYQFDTPELADKYVVRRMHFELSTDTHILNLSEQYAIYAEELARLRQSGVAVPHVYVGLPENYETMAPLSRTDWYSPDNMIVAEVINEDDYLSQADPEVLKGQARRTIEGLFSYLKTSFAPERQNAGKYYLYDIYTSRQFVYGSPVGRAEPDFYMVDVGAEFHLVKGESGFNIAMPAILEDFAAEWGDLINYPKLREDSYYLLYGREMPEDMRW